MRKFFTLFTMCLLALTVWGQTTVVFTPGDPAGQNSTASSADSMEKDGVKVETTVGAFNTTQYRFAKNSVTTISVEEGVITKIVFTCTASGTEKYGPGCFAEQTGYSYEDTEGTWVGSAKTVQFTAETNQVRATKIVFTIEGAGLSAPSFSPAGGTYHSPIEVTLSCSAAGAQIYYTTNGATPTTSSTRYTAPIALSENTTIKAISALDGQVSRVAEAQYVFEELVGVSLADLGNIADDSQVTISNDAIVLGQQGYYLYLKDTKRGYGLAYGACGQTYKLGDVIPAGYGGTKTTWDMEPELKNLTGFMPAKDNIGGREALEAGAEVITISQVGHETWGHYVRIDNVTINMDDKTFSDATGTIGYYDRFLIQWPDDQTKTYTIYAIVGSYKTDYQLLPTRIVFEEPIPDVANLKELYDSVAKGKQAHFTTPLTAIYQNKARRDLYIIDATGEYGLVYGDVDGTFVNGDYINDAIAAWTTYNDNYQLPPKADTFVPAGHKAAIEPEMLPIEEISQDLIHNYLAFENVTISSRVEMVNDKEQTNYYMADETGEIMLYDRYGIGVADLDQSKTYNVKGFLTIFSASRIMEIYPIEIVEPGPGPEPTPLERYDVNKDGEINVADINVLIDYILSGSGFHDCNLDGEMTVADINDLTDYILNN